MCLFWCDSDVSYPNATCIRVYLFALNFAIYRTLLFVCIIFLFWYTRSFPLKAQDRAIRSEENFRYYLLTGKALPNELSVGQIVALRFAPDEEFVGLVEKALSEKLDPKSIKMFIKNWKSDYYRV